VKRIVRLVPPLRRAGRLLQEDIAGLAMRARGRLERMRPSGNGRRKETAPDWAPDSSRTVRADGRTTLRLLSYNIQAGIATAGFHRYVTDSWKHVLPHSARMDNLDAVARLASHFDIVGLQEVDSGSLRSHFINQTEYIAQRAHFGFWHAQTNRNLGKLARHAIGLLARPRPATVVEHKLPGMIPGRGALGVSFQAAGGDLAIFVVHLALGRRARMMQLGYLAELISGHPHVIVMGDLNCRSTSPELTRLLRQTGLSEPVDGMHTFPSWRPQHSIDHILVSPSLEIENLRVINYPLSDHLPVAMDVTLPVGIQLPEVGGDRRLEPPVAGSAVA
jgi:endonuclease/exonuclease/phosphatase family metal-dependent hydrolase